MFDWTAFFTFLLFIAAWLQLGKFNSISSAEFLYKLKIDLMNSNSSLLISLLDNNCLRFIQLLNNNEYYFQINLENI